MRRHTVIAMDTVDRSLHLKRLKMRVAFYEAAIAKAEDDGIEPDPRRVTACITLREQIQRLEADVV